MSLSEEIVRDMARTAAAGFAIKSGNVADAMFAFGSELLRQERRSVTARPCATVGQLVAELSKLDPDLPVLGGWEGQRRSVDDVFVSRDVEDRGVCVILDVDGGWQREVHEKYYKEKK